MDEFTDDGIIVVQVGVLHGGAVTCSNKNFPAIFSRISSTPIYQWIFEVIFGAVPSSSTDSTKGIKERLELRHKCSSTVLTYIHLQQELCFSLCSLNSN